MGFNPTLPPRDPGAMPVSSWGTEASRVAARERESWYYQVLDLAELASLDAELDDLR